MNRRFALQAAAGGLIAAGLSEATCLTARAAAPATLSVPAGVALARLAAGNGRYVNGALTNGSGVHERRLALTGHQAPFATILSCSDSRVPVELVFDQNVGDLFVIRNAGNFVDDTVLGTAEYGYSALGVKLIVVLGHESCGAVSATYDAIKDNKPLSPHLDAIENGIKDGVAGVVAAHGTKNAAAVANAKAQAANLASRSSILGNAVKAGDLQIASAIYHLPTGNVRLLV